MKYQGAKHKIAKRIVAAILDNAVASDSDRDTCIEPFVGSCAVAELLAPHFQHYYAGDVVPDLVMLWRGLQDGTFEPPEYLSREEYAALKKAEPSALRAFAGYGCSFAGKWFGGYASGEGRNFASEARRSLLRKRGRIGNVEFVHRSYESWDVYAGDVIYCDPPYAATTGYAATDGFDNEKFWDVMRAWREEGAQVFVSEYTAPKDWTPILEIQRRSSTRLDFNKENTPLVYDRLYV